MMTAAAKPRRADYGDLRALPENRVGEIVDGELFASPRPAMPHAIAGSILGQELTGPPQKGRGGPGAWWLLYQPELHWGRMDRVRKLPFYVREGVKNAWLLNPLQQTLEVLRSDGGRWLLFSTHEGDAIVRAEPFDAIELDLSLLWPGAPPEGASGTQG